jgi:hypothetical protein
MKVICETEFMQNQTHAELMSPGGRFRALRADDEASLFFSIGTDNVFYCTREANSSKTGWSRVDLSSRLASLHPGSAIRAGVFDVSQNPESQSIDVALTINDGSADHLYVSQGNSSASESWAGGAPWSPVPYDGETARPNLEIADVYLLQTLVGSIKRYFVVDVIGEGNRLARYLVNPEAEAGSTRWSRHDLADDVAAGSITSRLGQWPKDYAAGIYTFGTIDGIQQLQYQNTVGFTKFGVGPVFEFNLPPGASAIGLSIDPKGFTNFFLAADNALYFYPPNQKSKPQEGTLVLNHAFFQGVTQLQAATNAESTIVWGVNGDRHLAYVRCPAGSEHLPEAWTPPARLLDKVDRIAPFLNAGQDSTVMFAHRSDLEPTDTVGPLVKFARDPITSAWKSRGVPLPTASIRHLVEYQSYTTHVRVVDDDGLAVPNAAVTVSSHCPVTISANGSSHVLQANTPLTLSADITGVLTIVEQTGSLSGTSLDIEAKDPTTSATASADIRPLNKTMGRLSAYKDGASLLAVTIPDSNGQMQSLLQGKYNNATSADALARHSQNLVATYNSLPANGSRVDSLPQLLTREQSAAHLSGAAAAGAISGVFLTDEGLVYREGAEVAAHFRLLPGAAPGDPGSFLSALWGDVFAWLKWAWHKVKSFAVAVYNDVRTFIIEVGDVFYHVVADCIYAVAEAVELIFAVVVVGFLELAKWLGFLFNWDDILRTKSVLRNIIRLYGERAVNQILPNLKTSLDAELGKIETKVSQWADLPGPTGTLGDRTRNAAVPGQDRPQCHWALHHVKNNAASSNTTSTSVGGGDAKLFAELRTSIEQEAGVILTAFKQIVSLFDGGVKDVSIAQLLKELVGILATALLKTLQTILDALIDALQTVADGVIGVLDAQIEIPILSAVYGSLTATKDNPAGDTLTLLDLMAFVVAIPTTIIYEISAKIAKAPVTAPFPQGTTTKNLISAASFAALYALVEPTATLGDLAPGAIADNVLQSVTFALGVSALFGALGVVFFNAVKDSDEEPVLAINLLAAASYLFYVGPDVLSALKDPHKPYNIVNDLITVLSIIKTFVDNIGPLSTNRYWKAGSPIVEAGINTCWLFPAFFAFFDDVSVESAVPLVANMCFDVGGIATPFAVEKGKLVDPDVGGLIAVLSLAYGGLSVAYGALQKFDSPGEAAHAASA